METASTYIDLSIRNLNLWLGAATVVPRVEVAAWDLERRIQDQLPQLKGVKSEFQAPPPPGRTWHIRWGEGGGGGGKCGVEFRGEGISI